MLNTAWNISKHGFSLIRICPYTERICDYGKISPYTGKYGYDFNADEKIKIILLKVERKSLLQLIRLFC